LNELFAIKMKIRERMNQIADDLALGGAPDYSQYKYLTGVISGLAFVERDILDMEDARKSADED
jgi:hypothetical protein